MDERLPRYLQAYPEDFTCPRDVYAQRAFLIRHQRNGKGALVDLLL
jgi:hypothetical protein